MSLKLSGWRARSVVEAAAVEASWRVKLNEGR
jgi:hypothetical protein